MRELRTGEPAAIGPYRVVGVIGAGGMGQVYLGIGPDGRLAAVKQVLPSFAADPGFRTRFAREVDASRRVSGAYTAAVMAADPNAEAPWLASVYVPGPSLQDAVGTYGPFPEAALRPLATGLVIALAEIHRAGLIHRDFKPGNVLLTDDGPRVIDFGIAHTVHDAPLTQTGAVIGSLGYMSPEQMQDQPLTPAADVFALGAVLAFAAGGLGPFGSGSAQAMLYRIVLGEADLSRVPPGLRPLLTACLAKDPRHRPTTEQLLAAFGRVEPGRAWLTPAVQSMVVAHGQAARSLAGFTTPHVPVGAPPGPVTGGSAGWQPGAAPGFPSAPVAPAPRTRGRRAWLYSAIGLVTALAVAGATVVLWPGLFSAELSPEDASQLVSQVLGAQGPAPAGFSVSDDPTTPEVDGAPIDPLEFDRSHTQFACEVQADPPTPAEAGIIAAVGNEVQEPVDVFAGRFPDHRFITVAYLDADNRTRIMQEIRGRIGDCRTARPPAFTDWRFTINVTVAGSDEAVGYLANAAIEPDFPNLPARVAACDFARADAVVVRVCHLVSTDPDRSGDTSFSRDDDLRVLNRTMLETLVARARELQEG